MINETILDEIIPLPDIEVMKEEKVKELEESGFAITRLKSGGVFYLLLMIILQIKYELIKMYRSFLGNLTITHATGNWLDIKAADYSKKRKQASKVQGYVTLSRNTAGEAIKIAKSTVFKTQKDSNGTELRYIALTNTILTAGTLSVRILVEAEKEGADYNVPEGQIVKSLTHIEGIDNISNESGWILKEGQDKEDDESLRSRVLNSWSELSTRPIADTYKSVCESVDGVLYVDVDDQHPRGQGTVDIIVTGTAGEATESLLLEVKAKAESVKGAYDNILVKSSTTFAVDIDTILIMPETTAIDTVESDAIIALTKHLKVSKSRKMNELLLVDLIFCIKSAIPTVKNIRFNNPTTDISLDNSTVIVAGEIKITVQRE